MSVRSSGFIYGSAGNTASLRRSHSCLTAQGVWNLLPPVSKVRFCELTLPVGGCGEWLRHLDHRQACPQPILPLIPQFFADGRGKGGRMVSSPPLAHTFCLGRDFRDPVQWPASAVSVACPCARCRCGWKSPCAGPRAQTYVDLG